MAAILIIVLATFAMPAFSDAQTNLGDEVTLHNESATVLREIRDGDVLKCVRTVDGSVTTDVWTLNDEVINGLSASTLSWGVGLVSDAIYMQVNAPSSSSSGSYWTMDSSTPNKQYFGATSTTRTAEFVVESGTITFKDNEVVKLTRDYTWGYVICNKSDGTYCASVAGGTGMAKTADDAILCGAYTSGNNKTMYWYKDGELYLSNSDYTGQVNKTIATHNGTTDILDVTVSVDVGEESFTPYRIIMPYEVTGHASSGAVYSILGIIPLIIVAAIVIGVAGAILMRSRD